MGTGILATLTEKLLNHIPFAHDVAIAFLAACWVLLVVLSAGFALRIVQRPRTFRESVLHHSTTPQWGMVSMGIMSVGSATLTVAPAVNPQFSATATFLNIVLWSVGTVVGIVSAVGFGARLIGSDVGSPTTVWGLAVVPPMVSATTGSPIVPILPGVSAQLWMLTGLVACFFLSLFVGAIVFITAYHHHWSRQRIPLAASASAWIPLGVVGQSTAAAQSLASQARHLVIPEALDAVQALANAYGIAMFTLGIPLTCWATFVTIRGFMGRMAFNPGWWSLTFPIGTLSLGTHLLGKGTDVPIFGTVSLILCCILMCTWTVCAIGSASALRAQLSTQLR